MHGEKLWMEDGYDILLGLLRSFYRNTKRRGSCDTTQIFSYMFGTVTVFV